MTRTVEQLDMTIRAEAAEYLGWDYTNYATHEVALVARPSALVPPVVVWRLGKKTKTVCSVFMAGVLGCVYPNAWPVGSYEAMQVVHLDRPWGLIDALVESKNGREVTAPTPNRWHAWQAWKVLTPDGKVGPSSSGHQGFLAPDGRILEATTYTDEDGDGASTDAGAVAWRLRAWAKHLERYDRVRLVELLP